MGLRSIKEIFVIGHGPSSSHTMGPFFACQYILKKYKDKGINKIEVTLFGSLAMTGKGHLTDDIIDLAFSKVPHQVIFDKKTKKKHPNTMNFKIYVDNKTYSENVVSIGGGSIVTKDNIKYLVKEEIYPHQYMNDIKAYCDKNNISFYDYVIMHEDKDIHDYFKNVLKVMDEAVERGIKAE